MKKYNNLSKDIIKAHRRFNAKQNLSLKQTYD